MHVAFVNENTLGHGSYLRPFAAALAAEPGLGVTTTMVDAVPLLPHLERFGNVTVKGLRRWELDFYSARWRWAASWSARRRLDATLRDGGVDAVLVNTQSVGLAMRDLADRMPLFVAADATFRQLARGGWFGRGARSPLFHPVTLAPLLRPERDLFHRARGVFAWSEPVRRSLVTEYGVPEGRVTVLPPSVHVPAAVAPQPRNARPKLLFLGGDFQRKGGHLLLEAFRRGLASRCELHVVTQTAVPATEGVHVHRGVTWGSPAWRALWETADLFVFPSRLETFGIVLVEALAFGVPVVSSTVGAARDILDEGRAGLLVEDGDAAAFARAIEHALDDPAATARRVAHGRQRAMERYEIAANTRRLAAALRAAR